MNAEVNNLHEVLVIFRRRKCHILGPAIAIFLIAAISAFVLPKKYRSTATILIEAQEVPAEYVKANITSFADQRLQTINQRIMGTPKLLEIINRFNLYSDLKTRLTMDEIVDKMRKKDLKFNTISADVVDPVAPAQATIAFSISFEAKSPEVAQQVANELSSLYVAENLKAREQQSQGTSRFLSEEMKTIQDNLAAIEANIAGFKQKNINTLPELNQVNMQAFEQSDRDIRQLNDQLRTLREKEVYFQTQLANTPPELSTTDKESLNQLKLRLVDLKSRFSEKYPDVVKTKSEIAALERQLKAGNRDISGSNPDNPAYISLSAQLASIKSEIDSIKRQLSDLTRKRDSYQGRLIASPRVEEGYKSLLVQRNNLQQKYDDLSRKAMEAKVAHGMEKEQLGERFTIVDPARIPEKPASPNVPALLLIGLILGIGSGVGVAAIKESGDQTVRTAESLTRLTGFPVLATIPEIISEKDLLRSGKRRRIYIFAVFLTIVAAFLFFHFFIMDLDVLWAKIARKLAI
ncbi:chain length determinant protein [Geobacter sp. OR-1]|uniref:Wzz/FepE/Etk N-terminal domain-containing protein n=1 Tax=Geobacter sp. OR-1 TaxID=1266765 RepID=UPI0005431513|nr:Wzz/FepE/Etk N-terminal domain-containing protein [Geobacter sp. OR-1]GAM10711.1 chain length determinant protein [Geobacter sp. OR-1]